LDFCCCDCDKKEEMGMLKIIYGDQKNPTVKKFYFPDWLTELAKDAEKLEDACNDAAMQLMRAQKAEMIVEHLKKRMEEYIEQLPLIDDENTKIWCKNQIIELQEILGEKK